MKINGVNPRNIVSCQRVGAFGFADMQGMMGDQLVIQSYLKEIEDYDQNDSFDKRSPVTNWEKNNTLDC